MTIRKQCSKCGNNGNPLRPGGLCILCAEHNPLAVLGAAQEGLTYHERQVFDQLLIGALSVHVPAKKWNSCIESVTRSIIESRMEAN